MRIYSTDWCEIFVIWNTTCSHMPLLREVWMDFIEHGHELPPIPSLISIISPVQRPTLNPFPSFPSSNPLSSQALKIHQPKHVFLTAESLWLFHSPLDRVQQGRGGIGDYKNSARSCGRWRLGFLDFDLTTES